MPSRHCKRTAKGGGICGFREYCHVHDLSNVPGSTITVEQAYPMAREQARRTREMARSLRALVEATTRLHARRALDDFKDTMPETHHGAIESMFWTKERQALPLV